MGIIYYSLLTVSYSPRARLVLPRLLGLVLLKPFYC